MFAFLFAVNFTSASDTISPAPGIRNDYEVVEAPVLKVYSAKNGEYRFVAYLVKWKGSEVKQAM